MIGYNRGVLLGLVLATAGLAQDTGPLKLTLRDAVAMALKQNPQVVLANLDIAVSEQQRLVARSALLPQAVGSMSEVDNRVNLQAALGLSFPGMPQHVGPFQVFAVGARFSAPVFDLTLWRRYRASQVGIEASRAGSVAVREQVVELVVSQYLGAQRATADVEAAQSRVNLAQALYDLSADLQRNGVGTGIDTLRANVQLQNERQRLITAQTAVQTTIFGLSRLLNVPPARQIELADRVSFFETPAAAASDSLEQAYRERPELKQLTAQRQRAQLALRAAGEERLPKVTVSGVWEQQGLTPDTVIPVYQYQASLDIPLFTGGRIQAQRSQAELALRQIDQQEQELRNRIALEVRTSAAQLEAARNEVNVANQGVDLARQEVEQARDRFQAGVANNIEVITAQDELSRANDNQIAALYRYNQARADLAHAVGQMEALYGR